MSEYIVSLEQLQKLADKLEPEPKETYKVKITLPKIVRCRDCKFKDEPWNCAAPYYVESDGFCAWAVTRDTESP